MGSIGGAVSILERHGAGFTVESLAKELKPEWVGEALEQAGRESIRERLLPAPLTVWFVILMGLYRRTSYVNLLEKLNDTWWTREHWPEEGPPCTRAVTKARDRVGIEPLEILFRRSSVAWIGETEGLVMHGRRVRAIDGTTAKTPDTPGNSRRFGRPKASRGRSAYPQVRLATLADVGTRIIESARWSRYRGAEIRLVRDLVPDVTPGSLVLMDRYMLAYDLLWSIRRREASFLVRLPSSARPKIIRQFGPGDALVEVIVRSRHRKRQPDMPRRWTLRMITYRPEGGEEDVRLLTDLMPESGFTREELAGLYHERWEEETITDEIKTHLCDCATVNRPVAFRSQTPDRVIQELWGMLIAYNAVRKTMCAAAVRAELDPRRVSFTAALERTRETTYEMMRMPTIRLPGRYDQMLVAMARVVVPKRPGRHLPRVVKIKMSSYPLKRVGRRTG